MDKEKGVKTIQIDLVCPESGDLLPGDVRVAVTLQRQAEAELCEGEGGLLRRGLSRRDLPRGGLARRITQSEERG